MGWDRMAIMMISQCNKIKKLALDQQTLWESISLFQLNFLDLSLTDAGLLYVNNWAPFCCIEWENNVTAILSHPNPTSSIKNQWLCSSPMELSLIPADDRARKIGYFYNILMSKLKNLACSWPAHVAYASRLCLFIDEQSKRNTAYGKSHGTILIVPFKAEIVYLGRL